jgi:hypothetical protein
VHGDVFGVMQLSLYDTNRSFYAVNSAFDAAVMRQSHSQSDGSMTAHSEIAGVVEEDHSGRTRWINRFAQKRSDYCIRTTRFVDNRRAKVIELIFEFSEPLIKRAST